MDNVNALVVTEFTADEASEHTKKIRAWAEFGWQLIADAYQRRAWAALGYQTWDSYCNGEFPSVHLRLPREDRQQVVTSLRDAGLSTRAIAAATGLSKDTVNRTPQPSGVSNETTERVTGVDGKSYSPSHPRPVPPIKPDTPPREPRPAAFTSPFRPAPLTEPTPVEEPGTGQQQPDPAVAEWVGSSSAVQDAQYLAEFARALTKYDDFAEFDAERVGRLADETTWTTLENLVTTATGFLDRAHRARRSLRVVSGQR